MNMTSRRGKNEDKSGERKKGNRCCGSRQEGREQKEGRQRIVRDGSELGEKENLTTNKEWKRLDGGEEGGKKDGSELT